MIPNNFRRWYFDMLTERAIKENVNFSRLFWMWEHPLQVCLQQVKVNTKVTSLSFDVFDANDGCVASEIITDRNEVGARLYFHGHL